MQVKNIRIADIKGAKHNPESRVSHQGRLTKLVASIEEFGLIYPVAVTKDLDLIDGHRRVAAYKELGLDTIPAVVVNGDAARLYAEANDNSVHLSGNQQLIVWLSNPDAIAERVARVCQNWQDLFGRPTLQRVADKGLSLLILRRAVEVASYVGNKGNVRFTKKALAWLVKYRNQALAQCYIRMGQSAKRLLQAVINDRELVATFEPAE